MSVIFYRLNISIYIGFIRGLENEKISMNNNVKNQLKVQPIIHSFVEQNLESKIRVKIYNTICLVCHDHNSGFSSNIFVSSPPLVE